MEPDELEALLREAPREQAAALVAAMEPDEAVDALRDLLLHAVNATQFSTTVQIRQNKS